MKLKKGIALGLCLTLFASMALGSGSGGNNGTDKEISSVENAQTEEGNTEEEKTEEEKTEGTESDQTDKPADSDVSGGSETGKIETVTVEETVLLDQDDVKITMTGMEDGMFGPELKLLIENNSDQSLTFQVRDASVNGFMADTMMSADVASGKKANDEITFAARGLKDCGIDVFTEMEFKFHIFKSDDWETYLDTEVIRVETSAYGNYNQEIDDSGEVFYDKDGIKIIGKGLSDDNSIFGPGLIVYIENNSDKDFTVQVRDTSINGFMVDTTMSEDVLVGKRALPVVTFFSRSLEDNGITDIESVETSFHVFDKDTWTTIVDTDPITINF